MLQSTDYFNTSHSINTVEETAYMYICNTIFELANDTCLIYFYNFLTLLFLVFYLHLLIKKKIFITNLLIFL